MLRNLRRPSSPKPKRSDSVEIVDAVLEAARQLLMEDQKLTTEALAKRAGVGIASIYRYFPDRGALFAELFRKQHESFLLHMDEQLLPETTIASGVEACVRMLADLSPGEVRFRRILNVSMPLDWTLSKLQEVISEAATRLHRWLVILLPDESAEEISRRVFYSLAIVRGAVMLSLLSPELAPENGVMVEDLKVLVERVVREGIPLPAS